MKDRSIVIAYGSAMKYILIVILSFLVCSVETAAEDGIKYVRLTKAMVLNYGEPSLNRLKYLKVAVDVRVSNADAADLVEYHSPALVDALVQVFTSSEAEMVKTGIGKEEIRQKALQELQTVMTSEEGDQIIEDLLFSTFVVQN
jgi:flagellar FliL protein